MHLLNSYSPDLNPVEDVLAEVKHWIKSNKCIYQATDDPSVVISMAFNDVSQDNCLLYIKDSWYL